MKDRKTTEQIDAMVTLAATGTPAAKVRARRALLLALSADGYNRRACGVLSDRLISERRQAYRQAQANQAVYPTSTAHGEPQQAPDAQGYTVQMCDEHGFTDCELCQKG